MPELTDEEQRVREWMDNAIWHDDVVRAVCRLADSCPGVEEWAVLLALIWVWDGLDAGCKVDALCAVAAPRKGLVDGLLLDPPADEPTPTEAAAQPDAAFARVTVGTRVVEHKAEGGTVYEGVVIGVNEECVTVRRERPPVINDRPTVALRWNEFAVLPQSPEGRGWDGDA